MPSSQTVNNNLVDIKDDKIDYFEPRNYFIGCLQSIVEKRKTVCIELENFGKIYLLTSQHGYFNSSRSLKDFCIIKNANYKIRPLSSVEIDTLFLSRNDFRPLDELLWSASFYASGGRLLAGSCSPINVIQLKRWPNLTRLPCTENSIQIAALLTRHPCSIKIVSRMLEIPIQEVCQFYSAASAAGLLKIINHKIAAPDMKPHKNRNILGMLFNKVASLTS